MTFSIFSNFYNQEFYRSLCGQMLLDDGNPTTREKSKANFEQAVDALDPTNTDRSLRASKFCKWLNDPTAPSLKWQSDSGKTLSLSPQAAKGARRDYKMAAIAFVIIILVMISFTVVPALCPLVTPVFLWIMATQVTLSTASSLAFVISGFRINRIVKESALSGEFSAEVAPEKARLLS